MLNAQLTENGYQYRAVFTDTASSTPATTTASTLSVTNVPTFNFNASSYTVNENAAGQTVTITVLRTGDTSAAASVNYNTSTGGTAGTAVAGTNYNSTAGTLTFAANATSNSFTIPIDAALPQGGNKTFTITLSSAINTSNSSEGAAVGTTIPAATITIVDTQEVFNFSGGSFAVNDTDSTAELTVLRTGPYTLDSGNVPITVTGSGGFTASGYANFSAGKIVGAASFPITPTGANQTLTVSLGSPVGFHRPCNHRIGELRNGQRHRRARSEQQHRDRGGRYRFEYRNQRPVHRNLRFN